MDILSWVLSKKYADSTASGENLTGKNVQISDISSITGGNRITFTWYDDDNEAHTSTLDVMNGTDGTNGSNGTDGSSIWTTTTAPTSSSGTYTFTISNLNGNTNATVKIGDMIFYSYKYYQVASVTSTTCTASSYISIKGNAGTNATITSSEITGGHRLTITDANGTSTVDVMDGLNGGENGDDGESLDFTWNGTSLGIKKESDEEYTYVDLKGATGNDGTSATISSSAITGGHRLTITDKNGTSTVDVMDGTNGTNGTNGVSPTITTSSITGGNRLTITDVNGTSTVDIMNGSNGSNGSDGTDGASVWTTTTAPTGSSSNGYTFTISNLNGVSGNTVKVGDLIFYSYYYYTLDTVSDTTCHAPSRTSIRGSEGTCVWATTTAPTESSGTYTFTSSNLTGNTDRTKKVGDIIFYNDKYYQIATVSSSTCTATSYVSIKGSSGSNGTNGVSPTITSSSITGGTRLTITDVNGTSTVDVMNGTDGTNGTNGSGTDEFSGKKVLFLGDSFIQGYGCHVANSNANAGTTTYSNMSTVGSSNVAWAKSFYDRHSDATVRNIAIYGATFAQSNSRVNIWGELYYFYMNVSDFTPDYIIFDGGANDAFINSTTASTDSDYIDLGELSSDSNYTSFYFENVSNANNVLEYEWTKTLPSLEAFISFAQRRYPSAKLIYVEEPEINQSGVPSATKAKMMYIKSEIRRACDKWGVTYLKITDRGSLNGLYYGNTDYYSGTDAMHPRQKFYDETIDQIEQAMLGDKQMLMTMATNKRGLRFWNVSNEEYDLLDDAVRSNEKNIFNVYKSYNTNNLIDENTIFSSLSTSSSVQINGKDTYVLSSGNSIDIYNGEPPLTGKLRISVDIKASAVDSTGVDWVSNLQAIAFDSESNPYYIPIMLYNTNVNTLEIEVSLNTNVIWFKLQLNAGTNPAQTLYFNNVIVTNSIYKQTYLQSKTYEDEVKKHKLFNKQIVLFGDSIMYGSGNYGSSFIPFLSEDFRNACGIANKSVSGAVVSYTSGTTASKIITQMENYFALYNADLVMFNGGINDSWDNTTTLGSISSGYDATLDTTTFCGAFEEILRYLRVTKNVKVIYMTTYKSPASPDLNTYMDKALEICRKWGVPVLDLFYSGQLHAGLSSAINNAYFLDDGSGTGDYVHLTDDGYKFYASQIEDALLCGGYTASLPS